MLCQEETVAVPKGNVLDTDFGEKVKGGDVNIFTKPFPEVGGGNMVAVPAICECTRVRLKYLSVKICICY